MLIQKEARIKH